MSREPTADHEPSGRVAAARRRAADRRIRQRARLRPLGWGAIAVVVVPAVVGDPKPGLTGTGLAVTLALAAYAAGVAVTLTREWRGRPSSVQLVPPLVVGGAGLALAALQPEGFVDAAPSVAVFIAVARLPLRTAVAVSGAIILGLDLVLALTGSHVAESIAVSTLLCLVLAVAAYSMRQATESRDEVEVLLAQLEDARDAETRAAAIAERSRIARELHDVLAHSLSALTIQLEGARLLAGRDGATSAVREALARAGELAREGLDDARRAVGALRGDAPSIDELPALVERFRRLDLDVTLEVEGKPRPLATDASLALYRAAQEALTNALRYAPGDDTTVTVCWGARDVALDVENRRGSRARPVVLAGTGGGNGLTGMSERVEALGGRVEAGDTAGGFRVHVEVPA